MFDLVLESIAIYHLPFTVLLGLCLLFWVGVILGALDIDVFDFEADVEAGVDIDPDLDVDADLDAEVELDADAHHDGESVLSGLVMFLKFVNAHKVPTMIVISVLALSMWVLALVLNAVFNPGELFHRSLPIAAALIIPNLIASLFITKIVTAPLTGFFESLNYSGEKQVPIVGRSGTVKTASVSPTFGQVEIPTEGAPILIEARVADGAAEISKSTPVLIVAHDSEKGTYTVRPAN